jgi:photosystem II stability/assembly factor-like uncharacterized protein
MKTTGMYGPRSGILSALMIVLTPAAGAAQGGPLRTSAPAAVEDAVDDGVLGMLEWRTIGPHRGGRVVAVAGHPRDPMVYYFGATGGGVWKTTDAGWTWKNVSDGFFNSGSVGAVAISASNPQVVYVGMGEGCLRGNLSPGDGVYKSKDGGETWEHLGLAETQHIGRIRVHPQNPDLVYVAAFGHAWGPNPERGVYRSRDGGRNWELVLFRSEKAGAIDLTMDPNDPNTLFAANWEYQRFPWGVRNGGPGSTIYITRDGGDTWDDVTGNPGLPPGVKSRIGIAASPTAGQLFALVETRDEKGLYRSDDYGTTWQLVNDDVTLTSRSWYYMHVYVDPQDADRIYVLNNRAFMSEDGGETFAQWRTPHGDNHDLWIDPDNPERLIQGNDGGANISFNRGETWSTIYNQPTAQIYHLTTDNQFPYRVYGSQQDNSTISLPSRSDFGAITRDEWETHGGGESGYLAVRADDPNITYSHTMASPMTRYDHRTRQAQDITVWPEYHTGWGGRDLRYRFGWTYPIHLSPHDPNVLYAAGNQVFRSTNGGHSWEAISPDLSRQDPTKLEPTPRYGSEEFGEYWGPVMRENISVEYYEMVFAFVESSVQPGLLWAGTDDGLVHLSRDGGGSWANVTPEGLPEYALVSIIDPSAHDAGTAYIAATRYKRDDFRPYLYKTHDFGQTWEKITDGIPEHHYTRVIREDPGRPGLLYTGTEFGIFVSFDDGTSWQPLQLNMPVAPIHDMVIKENDLVVATHGRGFWILDDVTPLHQLTDDVLQASAHLFKPRTTVRFDDRKRGAVRRLQSWPADEGQNPPNGVMVHYHLQQEPAEPITLTFLDGRGEVIQSHASDADDEEQRPPAEAGGNRFVWNMRYPDARGVSDYTMVNLTGPLAPPGGYAVELAVDGRTYRQSFEIAKDPRVSTTQQEFDDQFELLIAIRDKLSQTHDVVRETRNTREQVDAIVENAGSTPDARQIADTAEPIGEELWSIEDELIQFRATGGQQLWNFPMMLNNKLASLAGFVGRADARPTVQQYEVFNDLSQRVDRQAMRLQTLIETDVARLRRMAGLIP